MTILAELSGTVTVTDDGSASLLGAVEITDAGPFWFTLDVDARAAVAMAQRFQQLGVGITINGVAIPDREIGNTLTIEESADSYGDRLMFQLIGARFSPFARDLLRSKALVEVSFVIGNTASEFRKKVFTGYVVAHTFDAIGPNGPAANVECMDAAALYAEKRARTWTLDANSQRSRLSIGLELMALGGIPAGHIDLGGDGGIVRKPLAPGNQPIVDYLRDFWGILGAEIGFEDGKLCARRYNPNDAPVLELNASNLLVPLSIVAPDTLAPNVTGVVSVSYELSGDQRRRTVTSVITTGPYARQSALFADSETNRTISEVRTTTDYDGTLDVRTEIEEWGWYARRAPAAVMQSDGAGGFELVEPSTQHYTFPDGSTRFDHTEQYILTGRQIQTKTLDADRNVVEIRREIYRYGFLRRAIWAGGAVDEPYNMPIFITDDGEGVTYFKEGFGGTAAQSSPVRADDLTVITIDLNADGTIAKEVETHHYYDIGAGRRNVDGAYGYGLESITWAANPQEGNWGGADYSLAWGGLRVATRRFRVIGEDRYESSERVTSLDKSPRTTTPTTSYGAPPRPERAEPETTSQDVRAIVEDRERIFLAGEQVEDIRENQFVESYEESQAFAKILARRAGARVLTCEVPIESLVHKFRPVVVNLPGTSIHGEKFYVRAVTRDAASFRERIVAEWYPVELR